MAITFLYEAAGYHNTFGYYFYDEANNGQVDKSSCNDPSMSNNDPGLCTIFPDTSMFNSGGCLSAGDTLIISIPAGKQVGWFTRANGSYQSGSWGSSNMPSKKSGDISNRAIWYSITNPRGLRNSDGNDSLPPNAPTRHYGWLKIAGTVGNGFVVGTEDLANLGDHDFNDVVYGVKLNGNWSIPGLPSPSFLTIMPLMYTLLVVYLILLWILVSVQSQARILPTTMLFLLDGLLPL